MAKCCLLRAFSGGIDWGFGTTGKFCFGCGKQPIWWVRGVTAKLQERERCLWGRRVKGPSLFKVVDEMGNFLLPLLYCFGADRLRSWPGCSAAGQRKYGASGSNSWTGFTYVCVFHQLSFLFFRPFHLSRSPSALFRLSSLPLLQLWRDLFCESSAELRKAEHLGCKHKWCLFLS